MTVAFAAHGTAQNADDPRLAALVGELSSGIPSSPVAVAHHVASIGIGTKTLHHPVVGETTLDRDTLTSTAALDQ
jgi:MmyB-like transcription regulator ligand binding domain